MTRLGVVWPSGCDAFRCSRYVTAVEAINLSARKNVQVLASWQKQPATALAVNH